MGRLSPVFKLLAVVVLFATFAPASPVASAQPAHIAITIKKAGFVLGVSSGSGILTYNGSRYPVSVGGLRIGLTIGASHATLSGPVYNLRQVHDIEGTYGTIGASAAAGPGADNLVVQNDKGVKLLLRGRQMGFEASLDAGGLSISLLE